MVYGFQVRSLIRACAIAACVTITGVIIAGCVTMSNVRVYADAIVGSKDLVDPIIADLTASCERRTQYRFFMEIPPSDESEYEAYLKRQAICAGWGDVAKAFSEANNMLILYGLALQAATKDDVVDYSAAVAKVNTSADYFIEAANASKAGIKINTELKSAVNTTATLLLKWFAKAYRQKELAKVLIEYDPHLSKLVQSLGHFVRNHYLDGILDDESITFDRYKRHMKRLGKDEPMALTLYNQQTLLHEKSMAARKDMANNYLQRLDKIDKAHVRLVKMAHGNDLDAEALAAELQDLVADIATIKGSFEAINP